MVTACPVCAVALVPGQLEESLPTRTCPQCAGHWISGERYFQWLERHGTNLAQRPATLESTDPPVTESPKAKRCPDCGRILRQAKVGRGLAFSVDRCGTCGGFWLDAHEWAILQSRNLHDDLHFIHSDGWQADVARAERAMARERLLREKLGDADFEEARRVRSWIDAHPRRAEIMAWLMEQGGD
jgi:Zn-finger nucleic acid-binding protein